jgi:hypothetical protein
MKTISVFFTFLFILMILVPVMPIGTHPTNNQKFEETRFPAAIEELEKSNLEVIKKPSLEKPTIEETTEYVDSSLIPNYRPTGLIFENMENFEEFRRGGKISPTASEEYFSPDLLSPPSVSNIVGLPPIGNQGSQGSCTGWAWAYYCLTHQIAVANGFWDTTITSHQFSPAFVYNQINYGDDSGSNFPDASSLLHDFGCATMDIMPYSQSDYATWPSEAAYYESMKYRIVNPEWDYLFTDSDLEVLKSYLAAGNTAVTAIYTRTAFYSFDESNNIYTTSHASGVYGGGHAVCVVGYDDAKPTTDGPGAFLLVNSWGSGWGDNGLWWMSYEAIKNTALSQRIFYYCDVINQPYTPSLIGSMRISHEKRGDVLNSEFVISLKHDGYTVWQEPFGIGSNEADDSGLYQNYPFPGNHILIDLSEASSYMSSFYENDFVLLIGDSVWPVSGVLESFTVTSLEWSVEATSSQTPHTILDNQPREEVSAILILPSVRIDAMDTYVGGTVEITGTFQGESEDTILDVGFEPGSFATPWYTNDANSNNGDQLWGVDTYHRYSGGSSIWCGGAPTSTAVYTEHFIMPIWYWPAGWALYHTGTNSHPWGPIGSSMNYKISCSTGGLSGVKEWAIQGPLDRSSATELCLTFWMDYEVQNAASNNFASVLYSTDGSTFTYLKRWWAPVGETSSFVGEQKVMLPEDAVCSTLYFAFIFQGDYAGSMTVDDIDIWDIGSEYENYADSYVYCYVDTSDFDSATMSFDYWAEVEAGYDWFSPAYYIGSTWTTPYSLGTTTGWQHLSLPIPTSATRIGFLFHSDSSVVEQGVYVDNVQLIGCLDTISSVEIFIDDISQGFATGGSTWSYVWDTTIVADGLHNIGASAFIGTSSISDTESTSVDNTAPLLTSDTDTYQRGNNITISGYGNSLGGSYLVSLIFSSGEISQYFQNPIQGMMINSSTIYWLFANSTSIPDGSYVFEMTLTDLVGNNHTVAMALIVDNSVPVMTRPLDIVYTSGTTGHVIDWDCTDLHPDFYELYRNGVLISTGPWTNGLEYSIDGLAAGLCTFIVIFYDLAGNSVTDTVLVTVNSNTSSTTETTSTSTSGSTGTTTNPGITTTTTSTSTSDTTPMSSSIAIIAIAAGFAVVVIIVLIQIKRKN